MKQIKSNLLIGIILVTGMFSTVLAQASVNYRPVEFAQQPEMYRPNDGNRQMRQVNFRLPFYTREQLIDVEIVNGKAVFEGDIILGDEDLPVSLAAGNRDKQWQDGVIPFVLSTSHPKYWDIYTAIDTINRKSNLSLIPRTTEKDYVEFDPTDGCASFVGKRGGRQIINVENCSVGSIMHEILHAAGFYHEQSRSDRDDFVTINWDNIEEGQEKNFKTYTERKLSGSDIGGYDYNSIMHYGRKAWSKNDKPTIVPKDSSAKIGQRDNLSTGDLRAIRNMYPAKTKPYAPVQTPDRRTPDMMTPPKKNEHLDSRKPSGIFRP